jgi:hypothetical protein
LADPSGTVPGCRAGLNRPGLAPNWIKLVLWRKVIGGGILIETDQSKIVSRHYIDPAPLMVEHVQKIEYIKMDPESQVVFPAFTMNSC